jgi:hypothetical protein
MNAEFEAILDECLDRIQTGESLENCLDAYPQYANRLRPLMQIGGELQRLPLPQARPEDVDAGRRRMLAALEQKKLRQIGENLNKSDENHEPAVSFWPFARYAQRVLNNIRTIFTRKENNDMKLAVRAALVTLLMVLIIGTPVAFAATSSSLPGEPLYPVKLSYEGLRLRLASSDVARQELEREFQDERRQEVETLMSLGREANLKIEGVLEEILPDAWVVGGLHVQITPDTVIAGEPMVGYEVHMYVQVRDDGSLQALNAEFDGPEDLSPYPSPDDEDEPSMTAQPSGTQEPVESMAPADTYEPEHTEQPDETYQPDETDEPDETAEVHETEEPEDDNNGNSPSSTQQPDETYEPATQEPHETGEPEDTEEPEEDAYQPSTTQQPSGTEEPQETPEPDETGEPGHDDRIQVVVPYLGQL